MESDRTDDTIDIDLAGGDGIDPRAVADAIAAMDDLVKSMSSRASGPAMTLRELSIGSAHVKIAAPADDVQTLRDGLAELSVGPVLPKGWNRKSLNSLVSLGNVSTRRGVEGVRIRTDQLLSRIDDVIQANAELALAPASTSLGSVRGVLYRYKNDESTSRRSAGLRDYRTGDVIEMSFPRSLTAQIKVALDSEVEVWGEIDRDADGKVTKLRAEGIEVLSIAPEALDAGDVLGLFGSDWTGGADAVDWVRWQRE